MAKALVVSLAFLVAVFAQSTITARATASALPSSIVVPALNYAGSAATSIVQADPCRTTFVAHCTDAATCGDDTKSPITGTVGPSFYRYVGSSVTSSGTTIAATKSCALSATTNAICVVTLVQVASGTTNIFSTTQTGTQSYSVVPVTAGTLPPGFCTSAFRPTSSTSTRLSSNVIVGSGLQSAVSTSAKGGQESIDGSGSTLASSVVSGSAAFSTTSLSSASSAQISSSTRSGAAAAVATAHAVYQVIMAPAIAVVAAAAVL